MAKSIKTKFETRISKRLEAVASFFCKDQAKEETLFRSTACVLQNYKGELLFSVSSVVAFLGFFLVVNEGQDCKGNILRET